MLKKILIAALVIIVLAGAVIFVQALLRSRLPAFGKTATLETPNQTYRLEIADTPDKTQKGLSGRKSLPENSGMLFVFERPDTYSFWMKDMLIPLDIIFLNDSTVVNIYESVPPPQNESEELTLYPAEAPANRVIELNAGEARKSNIKKGDTLTIEL